MRNGDTTLLTFSFLLLTSFGTVSVTNHAGGVVSGELTSVTNGTFTVGGRTLPLKVLPAAEQRRLKVLAGQDVRTAKERQRAKLLDYELRRIDLRLKAGEITGAQAEQLRRDVQASACGLSAASRPSFNASAVAGRDCAVAHRRIL